MALLPIGQAASALGTTPRMLRYRERLGLLPSGRLAPAAHRRYGPGALQAAAAAIDIEQRYGAGPAEVAFALRALTDPALASQLRRLGELAGRLSPPPVRALEFEADKARRLLDLPDPR